MRRRDAASFFMKWTNRLRLDIFSRFIADIIQSLAKPRVGILRKGKNWPLTVSGRFLFVVRFLRELMIFHGDAPFTVGWPFVLMGRLYKDFILLSRNFILN